MATLDSDFIIQKTREFGGPKDKQDEYLRSLGINVEPETVVYSLTVKIEHLKDAPKLNDADIRLALKKYISTLANDGHWAEGAKGKVKVNGNKVHDGN